MRRKTVSIASVIASLILALALCACSPSASSSKASSPASTSTSPSSQVMSASDRSLDSSDAASNSASASSSTASAAGDPAKAKAIRDTLNITEDYRDEFVHGDKGAQYQKYIVLHDTEGEGEASGVVEYWDSSDNLVAAHFVINKDGSIVQCVPLDKITHHAGYGDAGHNEEYGITEDGRDDMKGSVPIGDWAPDYGMNAWSIGIEMIHVGGSGDYPEEQLEALDKLIVYIDAYYGTESKIIDHKAWRSGNSDTSDEFAEYLANYQDHRTHK